MGTPKRRGRSLALTGRACSNSSTRASALPVPWLCPATHINPVTVQLVPWGSVCGRVVGTDGLPRSRAELTLRNFDKQGHDGDSGVPLPRTITTDEYGTFCVEGLVPGLSYEMNVMKNCGIVGRLFKDLTVKSGETRKLGNVQVRN